VTTPRDDRDLDALLRQPTERLAPPDGSWELVARRARRRKWAKASASVTAGLIVLAGAVPAVIAVRHNSSDQTISIATPPPSRHVNTTNKSPKPTPAVSGPSPAVSTSTAPISLAGFKPASLSFIEPTIGYLIGPTSANSAVVAKTTNDGQTWSGLSKVPVNGSQVGIRFDGSYGYVFGQQFYVTTDGGLSWTKAPSPGYIDDLETMNHKVWATVSKCQGCDKVQLFEAPEGDPNLSLVTKVPSLPGNDSTLVVSSGAVYLMVHDKATKQGELWASPNGVSWAKHTDPCNNQSLGTFATWSTNGLAALCGQGSSGSSAQIWESHNHGKSWTADGTTSAASTAMITAGSDTALVISQGGAGLPYISSGASNSLTFGGAQTGTSSMGFVGFISPSHVVAITAPNDSAPAFMTSLNAGASWTVHPFH
jgi:hypothetical protein